ncbi:hypothetical protein PL372_03540 [Tenacibaculum dicentrarchi]|nr:hypothetical protein [Tenacibaculum dicentrarchi]
MSTFKISKLPIENAPNNNERIVIPAMKIKNTPINLPNILNNVRKISPIIPMKSCNFEFVCERIFS